MSKILGGCYAGDVIMNEDSTFSFIATSGKIIPSFIKKLGNFKDKKMSKVYANGDVVRVMATVKNGVITIEQHIKIKNTEPIKEEFYEKKYPKVDVYVTSEQKELFRVIDTLATTSERVNVLFTGPSGSGKTLLAQHFAETTQRKLEVVDCASITDPTDWFGYFRATNGNVYFEQNSNFAGALNDGNCVILLDEINRLPASLLNPLFPILDFRGKTIIQNVVVEVGENIIFMATINEGYQYTGTFEIDVALRNRFDATVKTDFLPTDIEVGKILSTYDISIKEAETIVDVLQLLRKDFPSETFDPSTRSALNISKLVKAGLSLKDAFIFVIENSSTSPQSIRDMLNLRL
jgi:nitric oxide reductase NorQ protein